ncbi:MAG TPA: ABC transporter ATP-binding protein [Candidatus Saccharimonadales bacterium]|nr:ABC transporter ATP-binding protein [Candidatus Saccharimonadales bacterium]
MPAPQILKFYLKRVFTYPKYTWAIICVLPVTVLLSQYLPPLILAHVLGRLSGGQYHPHHWQSFLGDFALYAALIFGGAFIMWRVVDQLVWRLEASVERDIAEIVFNHLISQSANFHANNFGGSLVSKTNKLMSGYIRSADTTIFQLIPMISSLVFSAIILSGRAPLYTVFLILIAILFIIVSILASKRVRKLSAKVAQTESKETGYLADSMTNVMAIKSFSGSDYEAKQFKKITDQAHSQTLDLMRASHRQNNSLSAVTNTFSVIALVMTVVGVTVLKSDIATVYLILSYTSAIVAQLFTFGTSSLRNYNRSFGDATDMIKILGIEPEIKDPVNPEKPSTKDGEIEFREVDFTHQGQDDAIFSKLSLKIKPGEKIGLVGHSGSGKTTFMRLLLRFSDIDGGQILIDGQSISSLTQNDLRRQIAYVPQEPIMFHRSLFDNISYGEFNAPEKAVKQAAEMAHADKFIEALPEGYETLVGERGIKLSGGQRQRIAIARAMLKNAPILVLDEATSSLDSESEVLIQDALWKLMEGRTAIVIAHRLSTIQKMDRIIVLDDGKIVEEGSHKDLLAKNGSYAKLWAHQSGGFMND